MNRIKGVIVLWIVLLTITSMFGVTCNIDLYRGLNLVSSPVINVHRESISSFEVFGFDSSGAYYLISSSEHPERDTLLVSKGYWVPSLGDTTITLTGPSPDTLCYTLTRGMNLIGAPYNPISLEDFNDEIDATKEHI
jgi:hypothetical protein